MACTWTLSLDEDEPQATSSGAADSLAKFRFGYKVRYALSLIYLLGAAPKPTKTFHELQTGLILAFYSLVSYST